MKFTYSLLNLLNVGQDPYTSKKKEEQNHPWQTQLKTKNNSKNTFINKIRFHIF
jgi:hypothetical protein